MVATHTRSHSFPERHACCFTARPVWVLSFLSFFLSLILGVELCCRQGARAYDEKHPGGGEPAIAAADEAEGAAAALAEQKRMDALRKGIDCPVCLSTAQNAVQTSCG